MQPQNRAWIAGMAALSLLAVIAAAGCQKSEPPAPAAPAAPSATQRPTPAPPQATGGGDLIARGKAVFAENKCTNCHAIGGQGGRMGPDLTRVGSEEGHTAEWLVAHIRNPKAHNPASRMPAFEGKISDQDLLALGAYLASLK